MSTLICILLAIVSAVAIWLAWNLMFQNGRILLRLQALETQLQHLARQPRPQKFGLQPGETAPGFSLPDLQGRAYGLADFAGRTVALIFFEPHCDFCLELAAHLARRSVGLDPAQQIVLISGGKREEMLQLVADFGFQFLVLLKQESDLAERYQIRGTPSSYLIDPGGKIAAGPAQGVKEILEQIDHAVEEDQRSFETLTHDVPAPSLSRRAWNLAGAIRDFVADGFETVDADEYRNRLATCDTCDRRRGNQCLECGCFLQLKARGRAFACPLSKWTSEAGT